MAVLRLGDGIALAVIVLLVLLGAGVLLAAQRRAMRAARRQIEAEERARMAVTPRPPRAKQVLPAAAPVAVHASASAAEPEAEHLKEEPIPPARKFPRKAWEQRLRRDISST